MTQKQVWSPGPGNGAEDRGKQGDSMVAGTRGRGKTEESTEQLVDVPLSLHLLPQSHLLLLQLPLTGSLSSVTGWCRGA